MKRHVPIITDCHGSVAVMTIVMMFVFVGLLAIVIDLAHVTTVKTELQNAADTSALRGARAFLRDDLPTTATDEDPDPDRAKAQAQIAIQDNRSDDNAFPFHTENLIDLPTGEIQVGIWDYVNRRLMDWQWPPDPSMWGQYIGPAVRLPVRRDDTHNRGEVIMTLANIFGIGSVPVRAWATAALMGVGGFTENGCPDVPLCLNEALVESHENQILFHPDGDDTGCWTNLRPISENDHTDANDLFRFFRGERGCGDLNPDDSDEISCNNGVMCSVASAFISYGAANLEPALVLSLVPGTKNTWEPDPSVYTDPAQIPHYTFPACAKDKFNQWHTHGETCAQIVRVGSAPDDCMFEVKIVDCDETHGGTYTGGKWYGVLSSEPKLVQ